MLYESPFTEYILHLHIELLNLQVLGIHRIVEV